MLRLADLREILRYVPQYRDKTFVIALDGALVEHDNFRNLLLDITLMRSLRIGVVLVHGAGHQIAKLAEQSGKTASNIDGTGITDAPTLQLALTAANRVTHEILEGLSATDLRGACSNAVVAHPAGILQGVDQQWTGRVERIDIPLLKALLEHDVIPVIPPLGCDGEGCTYRLNSDAVAMELAKALAAAKLIYLSTIPGIVVRSNKSGEQTLERHLSVDEAELLMKRHGKAEASEILEPGPSKLANAIKALRGGVPRVHIIDGQVEEGLLGEVFSNEGTGTLVHLNEYQAIRRALKKDTRGIFALTRGAVENDELLPRTLGEIERTLGDFYVFDVDGSLAGCIALHQFPDLGKAEMACVCVSSKFENQGIGLRLMNFLEAQARQLGIKELFCLSTQAINYFLQKGGFRLGDPDDLPPARRQRYDASGRKSKVLIKTL
jgi:amino-acid N-acetyltransferase